MDILLTNDDGISSPGLRALAAALGALGKVTVIAPATEQSGTGHAITWRDGPIVSQRSSLGRGQVGYAIEGTPADCVKVGLEQFFDEPPDLVVSGINLGHNLGLNVFYSGTVAAAIEGAMNGILSLAVSSGAGARNQLAWAAEQAVRVLNMLVGDSRGSALAYNVNVPALRDGQPGVLFTYHEAIPFSERSRQQRNPDGARDTDAIEAGMISVTPLRASLTDMDALRLLRS